MTPKNISQAAPTKKNKERKNKQKKYF